MHKHTHRVSTLSVCRAGGCVWQGVCVCMMENYTLVIEKRGCSQCIAVNTTICSGFCHTQDTNVKGRVGKSYLIQRGCMPHSLVYHPARVPGCPLHVNNVLYYPESRRCHCTRCDGHAHRCVHRPGNLANCPSTQRPGNLTN
uniref:Thyroid stimulating hormone subunit beta n=1 Tax=Salmo trutta TaxID=8032 RepID=A0A673WS74_SALTR